jgi:hypothetical protein
VVVATGLEFCVDVLIRSLVVVKSLVTEAVPLLVVVVATLVMPLVLLVVTKVDDWVTADEVSELSVDV